jgi:hypothetical protein
MIRSLIILLFCYYSLAAFSQHEAFNPADSAFQRKYANVDFNGKFAIMIGTSGRNSYFLVDFSSLNSRFERVYFMNLSFTKNKIVNIDPDISKNRICFLADQRYGLNEITSLFDELKGNTINISSTWSHEEQNRWLKANDKYK